MYELTLTGEERDAFDFVGHRYNNGDKIADILRECLQSLTEDDDRDLWYEPGDVTINIPEHKAWEIMQLHEEDCEGGHSGWAMFSDELAGKMQDFIDSIV